MTYLTVGAVSEFCPWDDGDVDELDIEGWIVPRGQRAADWAHVAAVSVAAVQTGAGEDDLDSWVAFGCREGLRREESDGFASLFYDPIDVSSMQWTNGRHRGYLVQRAGASHVAVLHPDWLPDWNRE